MTGCIDLKREYLSDQFSKEIRDFCGPTLKQLEISVFLYDRIFDDGSCIRISTDSNSMRRTIDAGIPITVPVAPHLLNEPKLTILINEATTGVHSHHLSDFYRFTGCVSGADFIHRGAGYYDQFCLLTRREALQSANFFAHEQVAIDHLLNKVKVRYSNFMSQAYPDRIRLPKSYFSNLKGFPRKNARSIEIPKSLAPSGARTALSTRELECVALILAGLTAPEIAHFLDLSSRTVEHHIDRIKDKLGYYKKGQIAAFAMKLLRNPLISEEIQNTIERYFTTPAVSNDVASL